MTSEEPIVDRPDADISVRSALQSVREGRVFALSRGLSAEVPHLADSPSGSGARFEMKMQEFDFPELAMKCFAEAVTFSVHTGTHVDALGHWSRGGLAFSGIDADANCGKDGLIALDTQEIPPLIGRGVLIDVARYMQRDYLDAGQPITPENLDGAVQAQGLEMRPGDIVLFRTGWMRFWEEPATYMSGCPGIVEESARWLAARGCRAIGADQWDIDVVPPVDPAKALAVHAYCLADRGIYLMENVWLEDLAERKIYEFCFIGLVPPVKGATGFPTQMVAVV
jgi:kynurenine formamidase